MHMRPQKLRAHPSCSKYLKNEEALTYTCSEAVHIARETFK